MADLQLTVYSNPHYAPVSDYSEDVERLEACEQEAGEWFKKATATALAEFHRTMADLHPYWQTPRFDRERAAAKRKYEQVSVPANELRVRSVKELFLSGEISEQLDYEWTQFMAFTALNDAIDNAERVGVRWAWNELPVQLAAE